MPYELDDLDLDEISLVDDPASPGAQVVLAKRADGERIAKEGRMADMSDEQKRRMQELMDKGMSEDDARRQMAKEAKMADEYKKRAEVAEAQVAELTKALEGADRVVKIDGDKVSVSKRSDDDYVEIEGEKVLKSAVPAPVLAMIQKQAKEVEELQKAAEIQRLDKRADSDIPNFGGSAGERRALLKAVDGIDDEDTRKGVSAMLKAASKLMEKGFGEIGHLGNTDDGGAMSELEKMASAYADEKGVTYEVAFAEVSKSGKGRELFAKRNAN